MVDAAFAELVEAERLLITDLSVRDRKRLAALLRPLLAPLAESADIPRSWANCAGESAEVPASQQILRASQQQSHSRTLAVSSHSSSSIVRSARAYLARPAASASRS